MARTKLTGSSCEKLTAKRDERAVYFDTLVVGLALRVSPDGARTFAVVYRVAGDSTRRKRWLTLGRFKGPARDGTALTLLVARAEARAALAVAAAGRDPAEERKVEAGETIEEIVPLFVKRFLEEGAGRKGQPHAKGYISGTRRLLENHVIPRWRGRKVSNITTQHVATLLNAVADEGKPIAARRVHAALSKLFNWCIGQGTILTNPAKPAERPGRETKRKRHLSPEEIAVIWPCMPLLDDKRRKTKVKYPSVGAFCQLLLLTGQRRDTVTAMRWDELDLERALWTIPRSRMKDTDGEYVFQSTTPRSADRKERARPFSGFGTVKSRLDALVAAERAKAGLADVPGWTFHDLRRTAASLMEKELDLSPRIIGRILDHADAGVTEEHYLRGDLLDKTTAAMNAWGSYLTAIVAPADSKVVSIRRAASTAAATPPA